MILLLGRNGSQSTLACFSVLWTVPKSSSFFLILSAEQLIWYSPNLSTGSKIILVYPNLKGIVGVCLIHSKFWQFDKRENLPLGILDEISDFNSGTRHFYLDFSYLSRNLTTNSNQQLINLPAQKNLQQISPTAFKSTYIFKNYLKEERPKEFVAWYWA